jgi:hypothetical protein
MKFGIRDLHTILVSNCDFRENWRWEGRKRSCVYAYTVKPYDVLKVKNGLVQSVYCVAEYSSASAVVTQFNANVCTLFVQCFTNGKQIEKSCSYTGLYVSLPKQLIGFRLNFVRRYTLKVLIVSLTHALYEDGIEICQQNCKNCKCGSRIHKTLWAQYLWFSVTQEFSSRSLRGCCNLESIIIQASQK